MKKIYWLFIMFIFFTSCKKKTATPPAPEQAVLISPAANSACLTGTSVSNTEVKVSFNWSSAANAESYDLVIKDLELGTSSTINSLGTTIDVTLINNKPYKWHVVSKSTKTDKTATSEDYKFFLAGTPRTSYAPFPASLISPANAAVLTLSGTGLQAITLTWEASDIDNDISFYRVYLDEANASTKLNDNVTVKSQVANLTKGKTYYWRIETIDKTGNSSMSEVYRFQIQ